jgi:hypothetical protein
LALEALLWPDLDAQDAARRVNGARCHRCLPAAEQLPSYGGATEREEEVGQLATLRSGGQRGSAREELVTASTSATWQRRPFAEFACYVMCDRVI